MSAVAKVRENSQGILISRTVIVKSEFRLPEQWTLKFGLDLEVSEEPRRVAWHVSHSVTDNEDSIIKFTTVSRALTMLD